MGLYITTWGIKPAEFKAAFNSKDENLLAALKKIAAQEFNFDDNPSLAAVEEALRDYVYGVPFKKTLEAMTVAVYAVEVIAMALKHKLPCELDIKFGYETDLINKCLKEDFHVEDINSEFLAGSNLTALKLTDIWEKFDVDLYECPIPGILTIQNLTFIKGKLNHIKIGDDDIKIMTKSDDAELSSKGYEYQNIKCLIENVNYCLSNKLRMFTLCG
jgi:hypothetical protein